MDYTEEYISKNPTLHLEDSEVKTRQILHFFSDVPIKINTLLDVACGAGQVTLNLHRAFRLRPRATTGVDISKVMIKRAREADRSGIVNWVCGDIRRFFPKQPFDLITCIDILEHVDDDQKFLMHVRDLGYYILVKTPLEDSLINRWLRSSKIADPWQETHTQYGHVHHYNDLQLQSLWKDSGLAVVKESYLLLPKRSKVHWELIRLITWPIGLLSKSFLVRLVGGFRLTLLQAK